MPGTIDKKRQTREFVVEMLQAMSDVQCYFKRALVFVILLV